MKTSEFKEWLLLSLNPKPAKDCISRCRKVEAALSVDLDREYEKDRGRSVISRLMYTLGDERMQIAAPDGFGFKPGANPRLRLTDLRSASKKYFKFCEARAFLFREAKASEKNG